MSYMPHKYSEFNNVRKLSKWNYFSGNHIVLLVPFGLYNCSIYYICVVYLEMIATFLLKLLNIIWKNAFF